MEAGPSHKTSKYFPKSKKNSKGDAYKQYVGSKNEGQGFADQRKRKAKYEYIKLLQKERRKNEVVGGEGPQLKTVKQVFNEQEFQAKKRKVHSFWGAEKIAQNRQKKKQEEREKRQTMQEEKETALKQYKSKKQAQHLKLCKKTRKGQPVMKLQMEVLLDKIKKQKSFD